MKKVPFENTLCVLAVLQENLRYGLGGFLLIISV